MRWSADRRRCCAGVNVGVKEREMWLDVIYFKVGAGEVKGFDEYYDEAVEPGKRERAFAWATAIGLQDVDGLKPSKYLMSMPTG